jgi:hypothetical protein
MPEPTVTATAIGAATAVPLLTVFGVSLGLNPGLLVAGAFGAFVGIVLLNTVPAHESLVRTAMRRLMVLLASSVTAGYLTPLMLSVASLSDAVQFGSAFVIGGSAQWVLLAFIRRFVKGVTND